MLEKQFLVPDSPPDQLVEALRNRDCILFVGSGLSEAAGYPSNEQYLRNLLDWSTNHGVLKFDESTLSTSVDEMEYAAESIARQVDNLDRQQDLVNYLRSEFISPQYSPTVIHKSLAKLPFSAVVTPNFDDLIERTFKASSSVRFYPVTMLALTEDGRRAVSASEDNTLRVWDLGSGKSLHTLEGHTGLVYVVALTGDGRAVSGSMDNTLRVWDLESGKSILTLEGHSGWVRAVALTGDGRVVSGSMDNTLRVWDLESGKSMHTMVGHMDPVDAVALTRDGTAISASWDNTLRVWDLKSGECLHTLTGHMSEVVSVALTGDGRAVSGSMDNTLRVWTLENGKSIHTMEGHTGAVSAVALTGDGRVVSGSRDNTLRVWDLESGKSIHTLEGHTGWVESVVLTGDGRAISASRDSTLRVWDLESEKSIHTLEGHMDSVMSLALTRDGRAVSASEDGSLRIWDLGIWECLGVLQEPLVFTGFDASFENTGFSEKLQKSYEDHYFFTLKLRGSLGKTETVILSSIQYEDMIQRFLNYADTLASLLLSRTFFFIGASLDEILRFVNPIKITQTNQEHYALVLVNQPGFEAKAERLERRYGIKVFAIRTFEMDDSSDVDWREAIQDNYAAFLNSIIDQIGPSKLEVAQTIRERESSWLKRVILENIGPFKHLELELDRNWNILLGDNGVGKSNIIRAIALGLLGQEAIGYANRMIRYERKKASVILVTNQGKEYTTELFRGTSRARIISNPVRLLDVENWLAIGFPPARIASWAAVKPLKEQAINRTTSEDILPLIAGGADPRLDSVKGWFIDIDYQIKSNPDKGHEKLRNQLMEVVQQVASGLRIEYSRVDPDTGGVYFWTNDGEVPIDAVSQGTASLIGWVGYLTERLFEIYSSVDESMGQYALVMIDEIDAHMHPAWQQLLVGNLKRLFPNVQFIATTHSPLITISSQPNEVFRLRRDEPNRERINVERSTIDVRRWRADQVLTSSLFGLDSSNLTIYNWVNEYTELLAKESLSEEEESRLNVIASELRIPPPKPFERDEARLAFESLEKAFDEHIADIPEEKKEKIRQEAKVQLLESITRVRRPQ